MGGLFEVAHACFRVFYYLFSSFSILSLRFSFSSTSLSIAARAMIDSLSYDTLMNPFSSTSTNSGNCSKSFCAEVPIWISPFSPSLFHL